VVIIVFFDGVFSSSEVGKMSTENKSRSARHSAGDMTTTILLIVLMDFFGFVGCVFGEANASPGVV